MTPVCVLRSGGDFLPEHVQWLARQVPGLVCMTDTPVDGVQCIPLQHDWPTWWAKMEMFGPALEGSVLMIDLDTVVRELPARPVRTTVLRDFTQPEIIGSGLMYVTAEDRARVWEAWIANPAGHMAANQRWPKLGDQGFLMDLLADAERWQDSEPVYSYKVHCRGGLPADAKVVCFHGKPRPWNSGAPWVPPLRAPATLRDFRELILAHKGKRICVMGGADTLESDLAGIEADVYISTNAHGAQLRRPDYVLAMDERHSKHGSAPMGAWLRERTDAPIISPHSYADIRLGHWPQNPRFVLSGMVATWTAFAMGACVVILAGCDGYGGDTGYVEEAQKMSRDVFCPVRIAGSGPLTKVWPAYNPQETFMSDTTHSSIEGLRGIDGLIRVRTIKPCRIGLVDLEIGDELTVMRHEAARMLRHRKVVEIEAVADDPPSDDPPAEEAPDLEEVAAAQPEPDAEQAAEVVAAEEAPAAAQAQNARRRGSR